MLKEVLDSMEPAIAGRTVDLQVAPDMPYVEVDADLIELVIRQLVDNALRYSPPASPLMVRAGRTPEGVVIRVRDYGPGIAPEEQARVFEKYYRGSTGSKARGTGLGLAIAREIARAHGGEVWLETTSPQGSEFCLSLPVAPGETTS
jgi:signal transduction histidine kinase